MRPIRGALAGHGPPDAEGLCSLICFASPKHLSASPPALQHWHARAQCLLPCRFHLLH